MSANTTEALVRKCFCIGQKGEPFSLLDYARAARRFCREEKAEEFKRYVRIGQHKLDRNNKQEKE